MSNIHQGGGGEGGGKLDQDFAPSDYLNTKEKLSHDLNLRFLIMLPRIFY